MEVIKQLLANESPLRESIVDLVLSNTQTAQAQFERWGKLAFQKAKHSSDSLRAIYLDYLGAYVLRVLVQILGNLVQFDCLSLTENADMADIISNLLRSPLVPPCDIDVSFPMSPFIVKHLFDMGPNKQPIIDFVESVKLDHITPAELELYFQDAICIGRSLPATKLSLLKAVVKVFFLTALDSIADFHYFVAENQPWFKAALKFSNLDFDEKSILAFKDAGVDDVVELAAVDGVIPLSRVDLLSSVTQNDKNINWSLVRAMAMTDALEGRSEDERSKERAILVNLHATFNKSTSDGLLALFEEALYHFLKYFLFELFSGEVTSLWSSMPPWPVYRLNRAFLT
jgi:hypothetical protein